MKKQDQQGFAAIEAVLVVVVLGILGFTGWFVWNTKQNTDDSLGAANKSSQTQATVSAKRVAPR
jgi:predicted negative regulator of RcsB-dependent stress response